MSDNVAHALAGAGGGIISMALTYPLITVSTRHQVQKSSSGKQAYKGQLDAFKKIIAEEGVAGLYSGLNSALFGIAITNGVYYYWYEFVKATLLDGKTAISTAESMLSGAVAGAATAVTTNPIWVVNTRLTTKKDSLAEPSTDGKSTPPKSLSTIETVMKILREDGVKEFWKGVVPALILVINPIIQYTVFEQLKAKWESLSVATTGKKTVMTGWHFFILGAISKLCATGTTYPYIVIKSRMQLRAGNDAESRYNSVMDGFRKIIKHEGFGGLYKGIQSKLVQSVLTSAFLFAGKEVLFQYAVKLLMLLGMRAAVAAKK